ETAGAHIRRGFYRSTDSGSWSAVTGNSLAGAALSLDYAPARPGKGRGMGVRLGMTEYSFDNSTPSTCQFAMEVPAGVRSVRFLLAHSHSAAVTAGPFAVAPVASVAELDDIPDDRWIAATVRGETSVTMPVRWSDRRRSYQWSD